MPYAVLVMAAGQRDVRRLPPEHRARITTVMAGLGEDPRGRAEKLAGENAYRVRAGDYRIVFRVDDGRREVLVARVKHRREVYRR